MEIPPQPYSSFFELSLAICLLLPVVSFMLSFVITDRYSWLVSFIAPLLLLISTVTAGYVSVSVWNAQPYQVHRDWFTIGEHALSAGFYVDNLSALMLFVVTLISFLVHVYSAGYMAGDHGIRKYFGMLGFFTFAMLGITIASNLLLIFFFWELVGFSSYMLIGHWSDKPQAAAAAKKAFLFNRIGDAGFLIGLMILWSNTATFEITQLRGLTEFSSWQTAASLCIFCGVAGKSAQFPLLTWLPDAMEGPTPVSALIHAATMVAAGIFLLVRMDFLFPVVTLNVIACVGALTALMAAFAALVQYDLKKILAYSTISQLGLMVTAFGAGAPEAAMLHLFTHAFFKACLFLSAGAIIHTLHQSQQQAHVHFDVQDIRNLGGLRKKMPFTFLAFVISGSALSGIPFFSGFLSKEAILTALTNWEGDFTWHYLIIIATAAVSFLTVLYTFRLIWKVFMGAEDTTKELAVTPSPIVMRAPIALLMAASLWLIISWSPFQYTGWLYTALHHQPVRHADSIVLTIFSSAWVALALLVAYRLRNKALQSDGLLNIFYLDTFYTFMVGRTTLQLAWVTDRFDRRWIDGVLHASAYTQVTIANLAGWFDRAIVDGIVNGLARIAQWIGALIRSFQEGKIQLYIFWASLAIIIFLIWTLF
jgi:NADH-quinone oxidoreductase subunit L